MNGETSLRLSPAWCLRQELDALGDRTTRALLRAVLGVTLGGIRVEGADRLAAIPDPAIFALSHHNAYEALLAPAALMALRGGRPVRFLIDWMYLELPLAGALLRRGETIAVYRKPARWRWREAVRRRGLAGPSPAERALGSLAEGTSVGIYPEGRRNPDAWRLAPLRRGAAALALRSGAPVVPIGIEFPARQRLGRLPRLGRMVLRVGVPLDPRRLGTSLSRELAAALAQLARKSLPTQETAMSVEPVPAAPSLERFASRAAIPTAPTTERVRDAESRAAALAIVREVYLEEKGWLADAGRELPETDLDSPSASWLLARCGGAPAGVVRLTYDPSLELPVNAGVELDPGIDLDRLARSGKYVEVGRLMISAPFRSQTAVVLALMRATVAEVLARGYTHLLTAVFEDDPHSPYGFHTRVLGFERIGSHRFGELACKSRRILLTLDIARALERLRGPRARRLGTLAGGWERERAAFPAQR